MQRDCGVLLELAQIKHANDKFRYVEQALVQDREDERADVVGRAVVQGLGKLSAETGLVYVILHFRIQLERRVALHPLQNLRPFADVPMDVVYSGTQQVSLDAAEWLRLFLATPLLDAMVVRIAHGAKTLVRSGGHLRWLPMRECSSALPHRCAPLPIMPHAGSKQAMERNAVKVCGTRSPLAFLGAVSLWLQRWCSLD